MSERIIVAALVKNEAQKYLASCLTAWSAFSSEIVVLDDGSTDDSRRIAKAAGAVVVRRRGKAGAWGCESNARRDLWESACRRSSEGDWIFVLDADMVPLGDPRDLPLATRDAVCFSLFDLWGGYQDGTLFYREDDLWCGHLHPRLWMVRRPSDDFVAEWSPRGIHCGHFPLNLSSSSALFAPQDYSLLHYAYADGRDRSVKLARYESVRPQLSPQEWQHALSIGDAKPRLRKLCYEAKWPLKRAS